MCGIVAILSLSDRPIDHSALQAATEKLNHRGPDGQTVWVAEHGRVGLGHALLNIVAAHGEQPIASEDGNCHIAVNGEFYDFRPIRQSLIQRGHHFRTVTDSEVALHLYEEGGMATLNQLRGEFAYVLWDEREQTLYAVRDRFGIRSLFYAQVDDMLFVASEAKALFAAGVSAEWDTRAVLDHIFGCLYPDRSLFANVRQVPPSHYLRVQNGRVETVRYWEIDYPRQRGSTFPKGGTSENIPMIRSALSDVVRMRTEAHVPVGCLLSGGVDSSAVLALAARHSTRPVAAFTIAFEGKAFDESAKARLAAKHVGAEWYEIRVNDRILADTFALAAYHGEMVQYNAHGTARFILTREIQKAGYRAVMAGEGADEMFLGYGFVQRAVQSTGDRRGLWRKLPRLLGSLDDNERKIATVSPLLARAQRLFTLPTQLVDSFARALGLLGSVVREDVLTVDPYRAFFGRFPLRQQLLGRAIPHQLLYLWLRSIFVTYHLSADRLDMAHAVEVRYPFLDHILFEQMRDIPIAAMGYDGVQKYLLRQAASEWLPEPIWQAPKQPFYAPPMTMLHPDNHFLTLIQDTLRSEKFARLPFFEQQAVINLLDQMHDLPQLERTMLDPLLMMITSLALIGDAYNL